MTASKLTAFSCLIFQLIFLLFVVHPANAEGLKVGYYTKTCPKAEAIVKEIIVDTMSKALSLAGALLRMHFHDCFVRGCEGSVLLNSSTNQAEKDAPPNLSLRGYQIIDKIKTALEKACPCQWTFWEVENGRRDGRVSNITEALLNLISPKANITTLKSGFAKRGLDAKDLAVLSGGHIIGISHCSSFNNRIYNFNGKGDTDPTLDPNYITKLKIKCKPGDQNAPVEMDPGSFKTFDEKYFTNVAKRRGLFQSDAALLDDTETRAYVHTHSTLSGSYTFFKDFGVSMVKMGRIGVLTGTQGEIRKVCTRVN